MTDDPAGKFGAEGGEIIGNETVDGCGDAAEGTKGLG